MLATGLSRFDDAHHSLVFVVENVAMVPRGAGEIIKGDADSGTIVRRHIDHDRLGKRSAAPKRLTSYPRFVQALLRALSLGVGQGFGSDHWGMV